MIYDYSHTARENITFEMYVTTFLKKLCKMNTNSNCDYKFLKFLSS